MIEIWMKSMLIIETKSGVFCILGLCDELIVMDDWKLDGNHLVCDNSCNVLIHECANFMMVQVSSECLPLARDILWAFSSFANDWV